MTQIIAMNVHGKRAFKMFEALYTNFRNAQGHSGSPQLDRYGLEHKTRRAVDLFSEPVMLDDGQVAIKIRDDLSPWAMDYYKNDCPIYNRPAGEVRDWFAHCLVRHADGGQIRKVKYFPTYAGAEICLVVDALKGASAAELKSRYPAVASKYTTVADPVDVEVAGALREEYDKIEKWAKKRGQEINRMFELKRCEMRNMLRAEIKTARLALLREVTAKKRAVRESLNSI